MASELAAAKPGVLGRFRLDGLTRALDERDPQEVPQRVLDGWLRKRSTGARSAPFQQGRHDRLRQVDRNAKLMFWASGMSEVVMPMASPHRFSRGPPEFPG
jgi:hypothetical protein